MNTYVFHITKPVSYTPKFRQLSKRVEVIAADSNEAYSSIFRNYSGWSISMFWPKWDKPKVEKRDEFPFDNWRNYRKQQPIFP